MKKQRQAIRFTIAAIACMLTQGCVLSHSNNDSSNKPIDFSGHALKGNAYGGQQPVSGTIIKLYAAGSSGYGSSFSYSSGTSLLGQTSVITDQNGNFNIPSGSYTCPSASSQIYIVATGGNPGLPGNNTNTNLALSAALGSCGSLSSSTFISINELTTIAMVWSLSPFMSSGTAVGTSVTNTLGLTNAFLTAGNIVSYSTGQTSESTAPSGATIPVAKINTLADILAGCVNSAGGVAGDGSACGNLFSLTTINSFVPSDTISAALSMARNTQHNVNALVNLANPISPFQPVLRNTPSDLNLVLTYSAGNLSSPRGVAVDPSGNIWVANSGNNSVTEMNSVGVLLSGATGYAIGSLSAPVAVATDQSGNAWLANSGNATVTKITPGGASGTSYSVGRGPSSIAVDAYGSVFVTNATDSSVSKINAAGSVSTTMASGLSGPIGIAINPM